MTVIVGRDTGGEVGQRVMPTPEVVDPRDKQDTVLPQQRPPATPGEAARRWPGPTIQRDQS
jgi:hypothetical protein